MRPAVRTLFLLFALVGCKSAPSLQVTETGWIIACEDGNPDVARGLPYVSFSTKDRDIDVYNDLTKFVFSSHSVPPYSTWPLRSKYEMTLVQHVNWRGETDGTWDLKSMRAIKF
jgi:hypothetical protein